MLHQSALADALVYDAADASAASKMGKAFAFGSSLLSSIGAAGGAGSRSFILFYF
jgi:hypothetical protein